MEQSLTFAKKVIKNFEGLSLKAYQCSAGFWTIGYGHKAVDVFEGRVIDLAEAELLLESDVGHFARVVEEYVKAPLNNGQFTALVSFVFNLGEQRLLHSTMLRKLNDSDYIGVSNEFIRWNKAKIDGKLEVVDGLTKRRNEEKDIFNGVVVEQL